MFRSNQRLERLILVLAITLFAALAVLATREATWASPNSTPPPPGQIIYLPLIAK